MPVPWLVILQGVPWTDVIRNAPKVADGARKLWDSLRKKPPPPSDGSKAASISPGPEGVAQLQARVTEMQAAIDALHAQMLASSELIATLAEQNARLIERVDAMRRQLRRLVVALVLIGVVAVAVWAHGLAH